MSVPEITPELLRAAADWLHHRTPLIDFHSVQEIHAYAAELEREQADEQRINTLTQVFVDARRTANGVFHKWEDLGPHAQEALRAGIRAVLAAYDPEKRLTAPKPYDKGGIVPKPVRQWGDLRNVPNNVQTVHDSEGEKVHRDPGTSNGWRWSDGSVVSAVNLTDYRPYTEIVGGDQ